MPLLFVYFCKLQLITTVLSLSNWDQTSRMDNINIFLMFAYIVARITIIIFNTILLLPGEF